MYKGGQKKEMRGTREQQNAETLGALYIYIYFQRKEKIKKQKVYLKKYALLIIHK